MNSKLMLSGASDGTISIWNTNDWACETTLKAHKNRITGLSMHPSGKVALSVSSDRSMCVWNLITFKKVLLIKAKTNTSIIKWSLTGTEYLVVCGDEARVFNGEGI